MSMLKLYSIVSRNKIVLQPGKLQFKKADVRASACLQNITLHGCINIYRERGGRISGEGKVVCVTGASGYVASCLVKFLLLRRYTVKATVRHPCCPRDIFVVDDPRRIDHLKALEGADERLELVEANLIEDGSFDSAVAGCHGYFHTASPVCPGTIDPQAELIEPALKGTLNVLRSCSKVPTIRRVVVTSSTAAIMYNRNSQGPDVVVDETWFSDPAFCEENKEWYCLSKTLAEAAAWKFAEENGMDLVVMNPGFVIGPLLQPTLNHSAALLLQILRGKEVFPHYQFVDVRDAVQAHILAFENPSATGRYLLVGNSISPLQTLHLLHNLYPSINVPVNATENPTPQVSKKKAESLGVIFMPLEVSLKDSVESLKEKNFLTI